MKFKLAANYHKKKNKGQGYFTTLTGPIEPKEKLFNNSINYNALGKGSEADASDAGSVESAGMGESLEESQKKNKYAITYLDKDDNKAFATIEAYSQKQAIVILKKNRKVYRILDIDCIEDHSKDDGEQLSMFDEGYPSNHNLLDILFYICRLLHVKVKTFGKKRSQLCLHHINGDHDDNRLENLALMSISHHSSYHSSKDRPANTYTNYFEIGNAIIDAINTMASKEDID